MGREALHLQRMHSRVLRYAPYRTKRPSPHRWDQGVTSVVTGESHTNASAPCGSCEHSRIQEKSANFLACVRQNMDEGSVKQMVS